MYIRFWPDGFVKSITVSQALLVARLLKVAYFAIASVAAALGTPFAIIWSKREGEGGGVGVGAGAGTGAGVTTEGDGAGALLVWLQDDSKIVPIKAMIMFFIPTA